MSIVSPNLAELKAKDKADLTVMASLVSTSLPFLAGAASEDVVAIRGTEAAFDDW